MRAAAALMVVLHCVGCLAAAAAVEFKEGKVGDGERSVVYRWAEVGEGGSPSLVLFLHGKGERGRDNRKQLKYGVRNMLGWLKEEKKHCIVVVPQCPGNVKWSSTEGDHKDPDQLRLGAEPSYSMVQVFNVLDEIIKQKKVDRSRIYITGLSMGGYGTYDAVSRRPDLFAAAVPICGGGDLQMVSKIKHVPMWIFHGDADRVIPVAMSRAMVRVMSKAGGKVNYTEYPGVGHNAWSATYANAEVWAWLFAQKK